MKDRIKSINCFESLLCVVWLNGEEDYFSLKRLRQSCPCAFCSGEKDIFNNKYGGAKQALSNQAFLLTGYNFVGLYGLKLVWKDGHSDGIYTFDYLKGLREKK